MTVLVLNAREVEAALPMAECIEVMAEALAGLARGELSQPLRSIWAPEGAGGAMGWMPAYRAGDRGAYGAKLLCVVPGNPHRGLDAHQGAVALMDNRTGELRALVNASAITAVRTAAVSAVATRALARPDATRLALIGAGVQARRHLESIALVRPLSEVRVASRSAGHAQAFAKQMEARHRLPVKPCQDAAEAADGADIIVTATDSHEPVLARESIAAGAHINAVGASQPAHRELDTATVAAASLFCDRRESLEREAAEYQLALAEGLRLPEPRELGEVLVGEAPGRIRRDEITLFRSLGLAVEDLAAALRAVAGARERGAGTEVEF